MKSHVKNIWCTILKAGEWEQIRKILIINELLSNLLIPAKKNLLINKVFHVGLQKKNFWIYPLQACLFKKKKFKYV